LIPPELKDSRFLAAAWRQMLETLSPDTVLFFTDEKKITVRELKDSLEGKSSDSLVRDRISEFFQEVINEAMKSVRGKFSSGL
jgi:hypothetical protein